MTTPVKLDSDAFYDDSAIRHALGIRSSALAKGRKSGQLRSTRKGGRVLYQGRWLESWLTADTDQARDVAGAGAA